MSVPSTLKCSLESSCAVFASHHAPRQLSGHLRLDQPIAVPGEARVIPDRLIDREPHKPSKQQVVVQLLGQKSLAANRVQSLQCRGPHQTLRRNRRAPLARVHSLEIRAVQAHLMALADGDIPPSATPDPPDLAAFVAGPSSAWRAGEIRPIFSVAAKPRYLRSLQSVAQQDVAQVPAHGPSLAAHSQPVAPQAPSSAPVEKVPERPQSMLGEVTGDSMRSRWFGRSCVAASKGSRTSPPISCSRSSARSSRVALIPGD